MILTFFNFFAGKLKGKMSNFDLIFNLC